MSANQPEHTEEGQSNESVIFFIRQNPYGLLFGDSETGSYEFIWQPTPETVFEKAHEMVSNARLAYLENYGVAKLDKKSEGILEKSRSYFETYGLTEKALSILMSINPWGDQAGIAWWGSFDQLKTSDHVWPLQMRGNFRGNSNETPIRAEEEANFANYVAREPFTL